MDKFEYRVKTEQMLEYMEKKEYKKAMEIADTIDWRRVKNASMLNSVSEIYEYNGEYQKSRDMLFIAFDRAPESRKIVYRLGTLALKINDAEEASDCYEEFVKLAPKDPNQYILKYKILKMQHASYDEQIEALENFKKAEYVEKWAYELALLYHEAGKTAECLEECDDLILWFSEGKYVYQAMELKMKYKPLTPLQKEKYDNRLSGTANKVASQPVQPAKADSPSGAASKQAESFNATKDMIPEELKEEMMSGAGNVPRADFADATENISDETKDILSAVVKAVSPEPFEKEQEDIEAGAPKEADEEDLKMEEDVPAEPQKRHSAITRVVKGATLEEALTNGVKIANGFEIEEKAMAEKTEDLRVTGQMKIEEILQEWEEKQKGHEEAIVKQKQEDDVRIQKEREAAEKRREEERLEIERKAAEAEAARKAAEEEAARKAAEEEAARKAAEEEAARKAAEEEAARKAAEEETARKAAEEEKNDPETIALSEDIRRLVEELENGEAEAEPEEPQEPVYEDEEDEDEGPSENMGAVVDELQMEDEEDDEDFDEQPEEDRESDAIDLDVDEMITESFNGESPDGDDLAEEDFSEDDFEDDFVEGFIDDDDAEEDFVEADIKEDDFGEDELLGAEEDLEEEDFEEEDFEEEYFDEEEELPEISEPEEEELVIEEPSEEEIQKRIQKSKGGGVPFDTGFVVTGRYDLSATSEIGLKAGLTEEQKKLFSYFVPVRGMSEQIVEVLDNDRRAQKEGTSKTGNLLVVGRQGSGKTVLAVDIVKAIQKQRNLKQGKVAIVTGESLNKKELSNIIQKLRGGAVIVEKAGKLNTRTVKELNALMERKTGELLFVLEDQRKPLERILTANPDFRKKFTSKLELPVFINDELVTFGQTYAKENGYKLDEMGILALYSRIDVLQREDHAVTVAEVKEIMDEAIDHSQKANVKHLARRVFGKGTDDSDRIILKEEDFRI